VKVKIEIDTKTFVRFWLVVIGFGLSGFAVYSAKDGLGIVLAALLLALALNAPVHAIANKLPNRSRLIATMSAFIGVVVFLGIFIALVLPPIIGQTAHFVDTLPSLVDKNRSQLSGVNSFVESHHLQPQVDKAMEDLKSKAGGWAANIGGNVISGVTSVFGFAFALFLTLVMSFLMLLEGPQWMERIWKLYRNPVTMKQHKDLAYKMYRVFQGYVNGQLAVSGVGGILAGLTVFIISMFFPDVPSNLALPSAAIAFIISLIPMFGATIAGIIVTIMLGLNSLMAGVIFAVYFIIYQQIENNLIAPQIQSRTIQLSALAVIIAVTIGTYVFGIAGGVISIPIAGCIKVLMEYYLEHRAPAPVKAEHGGVKLLKKLKREA
jgi:predicted PurR-regulated permease PerM